MPVYREAPTKKLRRMGGFTDENAKSGVVLQYSPTTSLKNELVDGLRGSKSSRDDKQRSLVVSTT